MPCVGLCAVVTEYEFYGQEIKIVEGKFSKGLVWDAAMA